MGSVEGLGRVVDRRCWFGFLGATATWGGLDFADFVNHA